jgi:glyoxylase-like metal-dependent hydrolase (beta-lactamase superfamily II)
MSSPVEVKMFSDDMFGENAFVVFGGQGAECWIVDPGFQTEELFAWVRDNRLSPGLILNTHCHGDHIAGNRLLKTEIPDVPLCVPEAEIDLLGDPTLNLSRPFGLCVTSPSADKTMAPGDSLMLGTSEWRVLDVSGHSPGGVALHCPESKIAIVGDSVFADSIGRFDFPGSDQKRLLNNIRQNLLVLPEDTRLFPGHGPETTVGREARCNPFLQ